MPAVMAASSDGRDDCQDLVGDGRARRLDGATTTTDDHLMVYDDAAKGVCETL